jgi:uncharacterized protein
MARANDDEERCRQQEIFRQVDAAFKAGDVEALRAALGDPDGFPNVEGPAGLGFCLTYAIYHSPLAFIRTLLEMGADPNADEGDGFPPLIAALSATTDVAGFVGRTDVPDILRLLLAAGADVHQRGVNDYTPLHWAAFNGDLAAVEILLEYGAPTDVRTRIDEYETSRDMALRRGFGQIVARLERAANPASDRRHRR